MRSTFLGIVALVSVVGSTHAQDWQAGAKPEWQSVVAKAKQEGVVGVAGHPALGKALAAAFERDTGIRMQYVGGPTNEIASRLEREVVSDNVTVDVFLGGPGGYHELRERGELMPLRPLLMLPTVYEAKNWKHSALKWDDPEETFMLQTVEWVHCWPVFNSNAVKPGAITSWRQLLEPRYKGKIAAIDPRTAGAGLAVAAYLRMTFDIDFVKKLYVDQAVAYTRDGRQLVEWAVRGSYPIVLGAVPTNVELFRRQGVKSIYVRQLDDGPGSVLGGFSVVKAPKRAPHPNAAAVFVNWYASKQGQQVYATQMLEPSLRVDVGLTGIPQYVVPADAVKYLDQYEPKFYLNARTQVESDVKLALGGR